ncbi:MAG: pitrilysin family protein [Chloroflexota bacterium]|nr:pitrilysin family protein [Chloroflexota bacterium]MDE2910016.1 pitrilysin family protein [Chloroflexota bacterium]
MKRIVLLVFCILLATSPSFAEGEQALDIEHYWLDNGLEVILARDATAPTVAVDIWYKVGSANDPEGKSGFAHLFEHMMFEGSPHIPNNGMDQLLEPVGGSSNAYVGADYTVYYDTVPSHQLPLALWIEADRMGGLDVTQINLDNQRAIVIEELQRSYDNRPYGTAVKALITVPYSYEPYKRPAIGNIDDVNAAQIEDVIAFHRTYYVPNNATLVVAGDIDFDTTRALIEDLFGPIPRGDDPPALPGFVPVDQEEAEFITIEDPFINLPALLVAYEIPPLVHEDFPALNVLSRVLSVGDSSRLAKRLVDTGRALQADAWIFDNRGPGLFSFILIANVGVDLAELEEASYEELRKIIDEGVPQEELDKVIAGIRSRNILGLETALGLAESIQSVNYFTGDPQAVFTGINRYQAVTSEDIQRVALEYLEESDRHVFNVVETDAEAPPPVEPYAAEDAAESEPDYRYVIEQDKPPPPLDSNEFNFPTISENVLDNGLEVVVIEQPNMPIISLDVYFAGGSTVQPNDLPGVAGITGYLISRGTETRSAQDIAGAIEQVGGAINSVGGSDYLQLGVFGLIEDTALAFDLLADMTLNASFPENEFERERAEWISSLEASLAQPGAVARRIFDNRLYSSEHGYGNLYTVESLEAITRDDIVAFYESRRHPDKAVLIIAGAITVDEGLAYAEQHFAEWEGSAEAISYPAAPQNSGQQILLVDRPGSTQATFLMGNIGIQGASMDYFPARVMNHVLGGTFSSRLVQNIREEKGYTYSIGSGFSYPADIGYFRVSADVRNDVIVPALEEVFKEIERIQTEPLTDQEINDARDGIVGEFVFGLETYQDFVETVASYKIRGVELDRLNKWLGFIKDVSTEDVLEVANSYIHPEDFIIVVVGDADEIQEQLETLGDVTLVEAE